MHRKHNHRVGATRAARLSLPALSVRAWGSAPDVSSFLKTPLAANRTDNNDDLFGNLGSGAGELSLPPLIWLLNECAIADGNGSQR